MRDKRAVVAAGSHPLPPKAPFTTPHREPLLSVTTTLDNGNLGRTPLGSNHLLPTEGPTRIGANPKGRCGRAPSF
jgi:hypothetical protein